MEPEKQHDMDEKIENADRMDEVSASEAAMTRRILLKLDLTYETPFILME